MLANHVITFLEGVITFVSPCLLPLLPLYVAYFAGDAASTIGEAERLRRTLANALGFVLGFTILFTAMGAFASTVGAFFVEHQAVLNLLCGTIVIVLGLNYLGVFRIPALQRSLKPQTGIVPRSFASSVLFGFVFAIGWTPCVGAFLGSALSAAAASGNTLLGISLLLSYSLGLGLPFVIAAVLIDRLESSFAWVKTHYGIIDRVSGTFLVAIGALMATGTLGVWLRLLSS